MSTLQNSELTVTFEDGKSVCFSAFEQLSLCSVEDLVEDVDVGIKGEVMGENLAKKSTSTSSAAATVTVGAAQVKIKVEIENCVEKESAQPEVTPLPSAEFRIVEDYKLEEWEDMPDDYIKWKRVPDSKKSKKDKKKGDEVEYQVDEVDMAWLDLINEELKSFPPVPLDVLELYMDRLEKESFLQMQSTGVDQRRVVDDEAVCCICINGDCLDTDMIIFCDVCNIPVHQECYGVRYIPEGQWVCRRCLVSPSREVDCVLCPNKGGAFKQTDDGRWAHVACALWIPEVCFTNTTFLEPVEGIEYIPRARWRLTCFICKCKEEGACIQCNKNSCYVAFHVTCAQEAGIYMKMEAVFKGENEIIKKIAYCNNHAPSDYVNNNTDSPSVRSRLKECRRILAEKRNCKQQTISMPEIQQKTLAVICALAKFPEQEEFMKRLVSYWKLKRIQRIGVPLLPSLQAASTKPPLTVSSTTTKQLSEDTENAKPTKNTRRTGTTLKTFKPPKSRPAARITLKRLQKSALSTRRTLAKLRSTTEINRKFAPSRDKKVVKKETAEERAKNIQLRHDRWKMRHYLEKVRTLTELTRNRERHKATLVRISKDIWSLTHMPFGSFVNSVIDSLIAEDKHGIFTQPVDVSLVTDYEQVIANPMDLGTMKENAANFYYDSLMELKSDFDLMIDNCIQYNTKDTIYFKAAIRLRKEGTDIFDKADKMCHKLGFGPEQRLNPCKVDPHNAV